MKKILFFLTFMFLVFSCKERDQDTEILPAATQEGKNTGGALVNGQVWVAKIEVPDTNPAGNNTIYSVDPVLGIYRLQIVLRKYIYLDSQIVINISDNQDFSPKNYLIPDDSFSFYSPSVNDVYYTKQGNVGTLTITRFDKVNRIVSGTFTFKAVNSAGQMVTITEGRFDRKFL